MDIKTSTIAKCPKCGIQFELTNPRQKPEMTIRCPNPKGCDAKLWVPFTDDTVLQHVSDEETTAGTLAWQGQQFTLTEGENIVGRKSSDSSLAHIRLDTDDRSVSRRHCRIDVSRSPGGRLRAIVSDLRDEQKQQRLPSAVGDMTLLPADAIVLADGDTLRIGHQTLTYHL